MKVVAVDNFARESVADRLVAENLTEEEAKKIADEHNDNMTEHDQEFYRVVQDDYKLWRGMEELI